MFDSEVLQNLIILRTILIIDWQVSLSISIILITYKSQNSLTIRVLGKSYEINIRLRLYLKECSSPSVLKENVIVQAFGGL
jgi:hypothetical protein